MTPVPESSRSRVDAAESLMNGSCPLPDLATAGQPQHHQLNRLAEAGYRTVIDLRPPEEPRGFDEPEAVRRAGLVYENIPVSAATLGAREFTRFRALLADPANRPAVVHCASANRVGALLIPYLMLDEHYTADDAVALAQQAGLRSRALGDVALQYVATIQQNGEPT